MWAFAAPQPPKAASAGYLQTVRHRLSGFSYDSAGHLLNDGLNTSTYDGEGRLATSAPSSGGSTTYTYDANGQRISKTAAGVETDFIRDLDGTLLDTYVSGSYINQPQEMWIAGKHYGTVYVSVNNGVQEQGEGLSLTNWLGSEAMRSFAVSSGANTGVPTYAFLSLPFGDGQTTLIGGDHDDIHFTGKERDAESGNDYFGARYYASSMGRWMSPDPINLTNERLMNPTNTLNKYAYGANNPLKYVDQDGKDITLYYRAPSGGVADFGHLMVGVLNQDTGRTAFIDYYPKNGTDALGRGAGTFNPGDMGERGQQNADGNFASLTIQTNPEQAQALIDAITKMESGQAPDYSAFLGTNCTTLIEDALKDVGLDFGAQSPSSFWQHAWGNFSDAALNNPFKAFLTAPQAGGHDYGRPRYNNQSQLMFALYWLQMHPDQDKSSVTVTQTVKLPDGTTQTQTY